MSTRISLRKLSPVSQLLRQKEAQLHGYVAALRAIDVLDEGRFATLEMQIRKAVLLEQIIFDEPRISLHYVGKGPKPSLIRWAAGRILSKFIPIVSFPFSGSRELFNYTPEDFSVTDDWEIVVPDSNALWVNVALPFVSREIVLNEARTMLGLTMQIIERNNAIVSEWTTKIEARINRLLCERRIALLAEADTAF